MTSEEQDFIVSEGRIALPYMREDGETDWHIIDPGAVTELRPFKGTALDCVVRLENERDVAVSLGVDRVLELLGKHLVLDLPDYWPAREELPEPIAAVEESLRERTVAAAAELTMEEIVLRQTLHDHLRRAARLAKQTGPARLESQLAAALELAPKPTW